MNCRGYVWVSFFCVILMLCPLTGRAEAAEDSKEQNTVSADIDVLEPEIQALKEEIVELNTLLFKLQEDLLFPEDSSVVVFLSVEGDHYFQLDSVKLTLNDQMVASYLYTDREKKALKKGGIQRLYIGNVRSGEHHLVAIFNGEGPQQVDYKRAETFSFKKEKGPVFIKLIVRDHLEMKRVEFAYETWN